MKHFKAIYFTKSDILSGDVSFSKDLPGYIGKFMLNSVLLRIQMR